MLNFRFLRGTLTSQECREEGEQTLGWCRPVRTRRGLGGVGLYQGCARCLVSVVGLSSGRWVGNVHVTWEGRTRTSEWQFGPA